MTEPRAVVNGRGARAALWSGTRADAATVRYVALLRSVAALAVACAGSFLPHPIGAARTLFLAAGLVWLPWSVLMLFAVEQPDGRLALLGGPAGDIAILFVLQMLTSGANAAILVGYLVVVAFSVTTAGQSFATLLAGLALTLTLTAQPLLPSSERLDWWTIIAFSAGMVAVLALMDRIGTLQDRAVARYQRLQSKGDTILAHVSTAVVVTDAEGRLLECNPAATRIFGDQHEELIGLPCAEALGLRAGERRLDCSSGCQLLKLTHGAEAAAGEEVWRTDGCGNRQPLLANATVVTSPDGDQEVIHSLRDVTKLKEAEEAKTLFLATASHELKTPLTVIRGFAETLLAYQDLDGDTKQAALDAIRRRAQELTRIVERLLLSSRIEAGQIALPLEDLDLRPLLQERVTAFAAATGRNVAFVDDGGVLDVRANNDALLTVVDHLIDNALKYSPGGGPVRVTARSCPSAVSIDVADEGIGMDADQAAHCFEKFWQAESTDRRRFGGTGIGLYIVQSLVESLEGTVTVQSRQGVGSSFTVRLRPAADIPQSSPGIGEATSIREFMRQIGVPERAAR